MRAGKRVQMNMRLMNEYNGTKVEKYLGVMPKDLLIPLVWVEEVIFAILYTLFLYKKDYIEKNSFLIQRS
jgi:hypothetical protein